MSWVMSNPTMNEIKPRRRRLLGIMMGAGLTLLFGAVAAMLASLAEAPSVMLFLSATAFLAAGFVALRLMKAAQPIEPAIGATVTVLLISLLQLGLTPGLTEGLTAAQVMISLLVSLVFAFSLVWVGGVFGYRSRLRASAPTAHVPPRASGETRAMDRLGPSSRPAPHSG